MGKTINACGLACPGPVLLVKDEVEQSAPREITVLVDNAGSMENVSRFLSSRGYSVIDSRQDGNFRLDAQCDQKTTAVVMEKVAVSGRNISKQKNLVLITSDSLGAGDDKLGQKLMISYLKTLKEMGPELWQLIFVNGGVKLTIESSPVLQELQEYEQAGVIIFACGTCLEHFGLTARKKVGGTTNMLDIVMATQLADKVVTIS